MSSLILICLQSLVDVRNILKWIQPDVSLIMKTHKEASPSLSDNKSSPSLFPFLLFILRLIPISFQSLINVSDVFQWVKSKLFLVMGCHKKPPPSLVYHKDSPSRLSFLFLLFYGSVFSCSLFEGSFESRDILEWIKFNFSFSVQTKQESSPPLGDDKCSPSLLSLLRFGQLFVLLSFQSAIDVGDVFQRIKP